MDIGREGKPFRAEPLEDPFPHDGEVAMPPGPIASTFAGVQATQETAERDAKHAARAAHGSVTT